MTRGLVFSVFLVACDAPTIAVASADASADAAIDASETSACATKSKTIAIDGGACGTFDEDGDCVPDDCDPCPNVPFDPIAKSPGTAKASVECTPPNATFEHINERLFFDAFNANNAAWIDTDAKPVAGEKFTIDPKSGVARMTAMAGGHTATLNLSPGARDVSVIAVMTVRQSGGVGGGIALRVRMRTATETLRQYTCTTDGARILLQHDDCVGICTSLILAEKPLPSDVDPEKPMVIRGVAATIDGNVSLQCQIFAAPRDANEVRATLLDDKTSDRNTVSKLVTVDPLLQGDVGVRADGVSVVVQSFDVLVSP